MTAQKRTCLLIALLLQLAAHKHKTVSPLTIAWPDISGVACMLARCIEGLCVYTRTAVMSARSPKPSSGHLPQAWAR